MSEPSLWTVTSYYNPTGSRRRREHFQTFRHYLGTPLLAVELSSTGAYELCASEADILLQVSGESFLWQKERLLNLAIGALPAAASHVAWIDCDIIIAQPDWPAQAISAMDAGASIVQLFESAFHLGPDFAFPDPPDFEQLKARCIFREQSATSLFVTGGYSLPLQQTTRAAAAAGVAGIPVSHGQAWAAKRSVVGRAGLYDACIIGGGDKAFALACFGLSEALAAHRPMTGSHFAHYRRWAQSLADAAAGAPSFIACDLFHLWHGAYADRHYDARHLALARSGFDPERHLKVASNGSWAWTHAAGYAIRGLVKDYFASRREA